MMSVAEMAQLSALLDEAMPLDRDERRRWIERLPAEHRRLTDALRQPLCEPTGPLASKLDSPPVTRACLRRLLAARSMRPGRAIGPYRLLMQLGTGGMAEVWLARDGEGRHVALKMPRVSLFGSDLSRRFERECELLGQLEHANVVQMVDAGVDREGIPYLVMEYVTGEPLNSWCDTRQIGLRPRIELFLQLTDAVQHVHARQVIHCDLKPSNILVTPDGQLRLLDFGVARRRAGADEPPRQVEAVSGGMALTPDYASPELLCNHPVDVASDVYALGIVLYELLTGNRPYRFDSRSSATRLQQEIAALRIGRPSANLAPEASRMRASSPRGLERLLRGDLDVIVTKALSRTPDRRYQSAAALGVDLRRHLDGQPILARAGRPSRMARRSLAWRPLARALRVLLPTRMPAQDQRRSAEAA